MSDPLWMTAGRTHPCPGCPWIKDNAEASCRIEGAHEEMASAFSGEWGGHRIMRCHQVPDEDPRGGACIGYLLSDHAADNINVALLYEADPETPARIGSHRPMHATYRDMRAALDEQWGTEPPPAKPTDERDRTVEDDVRANLEKLTGELAEEGRLIEAGWQALRLMVIPPGAPAVQLKEMRKAYFSGAQHLFASLAVLFDGSKDGEVGEADLARVDQIHDELEAFIEELLAEHPGLAT